MWFPKQEYWTELSFLSPGGFSQCRDRTQVSCTAGDLLHCSRILYRLSQQENPEFENKLTEIIQTKHKEKKEWAKMEQNIHSTWGIVKQYNIPVVWILLAYHIQTIESPLVKNLPAMGEIWVCFLGWEDFPGEGKGYSLQYSGLENSMDSIVHGITMSWTRLGDFSSFSQL